MRPPKLPAFVVVLWVTSTLLWWTFAFTPLPSAPPPWLRAARAACFGAMENGLPAAQGWMLLVLAPASFLVAIVVLWGAELPASLRHAACTPLGRGVFVVMALALVAEGAWVARKVHAAWAVTTWALSPQDDTALPAEYPRQATVAPDFALVDQHGATVSLMSFRGRSVVLTFVFAHCQTMCPLIVDTLKRAAPGAGPSEVLLVTLDPWRDTPSSLPGFAARWTMPERFRVLSSRNVQDVVNVIQAYGVPFTRDERSGDITHPGLVFLIDAGGRLVYTFSNPSPAWIREGLIRLERLHASRE
jgi:protein SCO1/2